MKKMIIIGSFCAVTLLFLASFSSVVAYQTVQSQKDQIVQSFKNRPRSLVESFIQLQQKTLNAYDTYETFLNENGAGTDVYARSLLNRCTAFHDTIADAPSTQRILVVLVLTILTEFVVYLGSVGAPVFVLLLLSVIINSITNPAINIIYYNIYNNVFVLESLVVIVETFLIFVLFNAASIGMTLAQAFFLSLIANLMSYIIATGLARLVFDVLSLTE